MSAAFGRPLARERAHRIAEPFRPASRLGNRWNYFYTRTKLGTDPLYPAVADALRGTACPVLDLGCGLGLLAHTLREDGIGLPYRGVDIDAGKIAEGARIARRAGLVDVAFETIDLARSLPDHRGSVALLDVLQYVDADAQARIVDGAAAMLVPGARLVIRTGLDDGGARARFTHFSDVLGRVSGWMHSAPRRYPRAADLEARLDAAGLASEFVPLYGNTPFNNWRIVARRD